jgi:hypothetical protein
VAVPERDDAATAAGPLPTEDRVALPQPPAPPHTSAPFPAVLDGTLGFLAVVLAFLIALMPARNTDVWLHLATGKALADGTWRFGPEPFTYTGGTEPAVIHSWFDDWMSYQNFRLFGGPGLVICKALLIAVLAFVMIRLGRAGQGVGLPAACTALALIAMGTRLPVNPVCVSYLCLGLTLGLLHRAARLRATGSGWLAAYLPLPLLFALWVNLDSWFLLGPITVALYLTGEALGAARRPRPDFAGLAILVVVSVLACLINPWHIHAFTLPADLGLTGAAKVLRQDPAFQALFLSPFQSEYLRSSTALSASGAALLVLALASALSFLISHEGVHSWRLPVWLAFFLLACGWVRTAPFFAIVAGPILALNIEDFLTRRRSAPGYVPARVDWAVAGRQFAFLLGLVLIALAWPGWLQSQPYERRGWTVSPDPSLQRAAEQLQRWRADGRLPAKGNAFNISPEAANYLSWLCPAEKTWLDGRLEGAEDAQAYARVRRGLWGWSRRGEDWRADLRAHHVDHLILFDNNFDRMLPVCLRLLAQPVKPDELPEWPLLYLDGHVVIFGWRDPEKEGGADPFAGLVLNLDQRAFHPGPDKQAPRQRPAREPQPGEWWNSFLTPRQAPSADRDEAAIHLAHFALHQPLFHQLGQWIWANSMAAAAVGAALPGTPAALLVSRVDAILARTDHELLQLAVRLLHEEKPTVSPQDLLAIFLLEKHLRQQDDGPPGLLLLAIRAARRAIAANPDDARSYLLLGEAYRRLGQDTRERFWWSSLPDLRRLRQGQAAAALRQALQLQPDLAQAHASLSDLYLKMHLDDLALDHLGEQVRLARNRLASPAERPEEWSARVGRLEKQLQNQEERVKRARDIFETNAANLRIADRAQKALENGLGGKALQILRESEIAAFGAKGTQMELQLLLATGHLREMREWMTPDIQDLLGKQNYLWLQAQLAAASGDYDKADADLEAIIGILDRSVHFQDTQLSVREAMAFGLGQAVLEGSLEYESLPWRAHAFLRRVEFVRSTVGMAPQLQGEADLNVLRGLLALECGDAERAKRCFERALAMRGGGGQGSLDFGSRAIAELVLSWLARSE